MNGIMKDEFRLVVMMLGLILPACEAEVDDDFGALDRALGECTTTQQCQQMYNGATDCDNAGGGVCICGNQQCDSGGGGGGDGGNAGECTTTQQCQQMYNGATDCDNAGGGVCICGNQQCGGDGGGGGGVDGLPPPPPGKQWVPVMALTDDFGSFDGNKWQKGHPYWSGRSPSKFNNANISYGNGKMRLKGSLANADRQGDFIWTACLTSKQKSFKKGMYAEARIKNADMAIVSSFWMQGNYSEIDVIENWGETKVPQWNYLTHTMEMNTHYFINGWDNDQKTPKHYNNPGNVGNSAEYAVYGVWWKDARNIVWYRNGVQTASVTLPYDFNEDMYMFFDMEAFTWGPGLPSNADLNDPSSNLAYYDYVKTYKLEDSP